MKKIIITEHVLLPQLLVDRGIVGYTDAPNSGAELQDTQSDTIEPDYTVLDHVDDAAQIRGAHVIGTLPLHLAAECASITEIPLALTPADRGELSLPRLREIAGPATTYVVARLPVDRQHTFRGMPLRTATIESVVIEGDSIGLAPCVDLGVHTEPVVVDPDDDDPGGCLGTAYLSLDTARALALRILALVATR